MFFKQIEQVLNIMNDIKTLLPSINLIIQKFLNSIQNNDYAWDLDDNQQNFNDFEEDVINNELLNDLNEDNDDNNLRKEIFPNIQCNQVGIFWK